MVACIVQDWKEVSERPKILKKKTFETRSGASDAPKLQKKPSDLHHFSHINPDRAMLIFQTNYGIMTPNLFGAKKIVNQNTGNLGPIGFQPCNSQSPTRQPRPWHSWFHVACYALRKDTL